MKLLLAALLAALVSFAWGFLSWSVLDWHDAGRHDFKDEAAVAEVIKANATHGTGLYQLPFPRRPLSIATPDERARQETAFRAASNQGPYLYAIVRPGRQEWNLAANLGWSFARSFLAALLLGALLKQTVLSFPGRLAFCAAAAVFAVLVCVLPQRIWFELPAREVIVGLADAFIEWLLAGLVLALFLGREPTERDLR